MKALVDQLIREVLRGASDDTALYAVVDCARDPEIYEALTEPDLNVRCLYSGDLPDELARAAPYVVELGSDSVFTDAFREAWGRSWGILLRSSADIEALRRHFKKLNIVRGPDGKRLLFRYYDPRVLRVFLPTCDEPQLAQMFGPVREFITEGEDAHALRFALRGRRLEVSRLDAQEVSS